MDNLLRDEVEERQARLEWMMANHQAAQRRRLVECGMKLWRRTEAMLRQDGMALTIRPRSTTN